METQAPIIAFLYDFDKTLCTTDMEDYAFIPSLGYTPAEFWGRANAFGWENRMDGHHDPGVRRAEYQAGPGLPEPLR